MRLIAVTLMLSALIAVPCQAQSKASSAAIAEAMSLLQELKNTRSIFEVGLSLDEYRQIAQRINIKLNRFLAIPESRSVKFGAALKSASENYLTGYRELSANPSSFSPILYSRFARINLISVEACLNGVAISCKTIKDQELESPKG